ncbi:2256_t:CDS:2, partial [Funneliformis mosseae]
MATVAMHIILQNPKDFRLEPNSIENMTFTQYFEDNQPTDDYYASLGYSITGVYIWILGRWDQLTEWNFWPIYVISIVASILLVIIMQNLLIAFMTEKPTGNRRGNPRYIYYVGTPEYQALWLDKADKYRKSHKSLSFDDIISSQLSNDNDSDDDDTAKINSVEVSNYRSLK